MKSLIVPKKNRIGGPFLSCPVLHVTFKKETKRGPFALTSMRFRGIRRSVDKTEQKVGAFESVFKKNKKPATVIVGLFYSKSAD